MDDYRFELEQWYGISFADYIVLYYETNADYSSSSIMVIVEDENGDVYVNDDWDTWSPELVTYEEAIDRMVAYDAETQSDLVF